jgi:hypothetical protein
MGETGAVKTLSPGEWATPHSPDPRDLPQATGIGARSAPVLCF